MSKIPKDILEILHGKNTIADKQFKSTLKSQLFKTEDPMAQKASNIEKLTHYFKQMKLSTGLAVLAMLLVVGTVSANVSSDRTRQASERSTEIPANLQDVLSVNDIREKALAQVPNGSITGIELENEEGILVYKVRFTDGSVRLFNAKTGELMVKNSDLETDGSVPAGFVAQIDLSRARAIAQAQRPDKTINKVELETENGVVVYSFRFTDEGRVDVSATDGSIVRVRNGDSSDDNQQSDTSDDNGDDDSGNSGSGSGNSGSNDDSSNDDSDDSSGSSTGSNKDDSSDDD